MCVFFKFVCPLHASSPFLHLEGRQSLLPAHLDESLLGRNLQDGVQLQARGGQLLLSWPVVALALPLPSGHHQEDEDADKGNEGHAPDNGTDDEG